MKNKILIVEDEIAYRSLLKSKLTDHGFEVITASDGESGLKTAISEKPDLILLDIMMPIMDGLTMLHLLRKNVSIAQPKVIVISNLEPKDKYLWSTDQMKIHSYYIKSDIKVATLIEKIKEALKE